MVRVEIEDSNDPGEIYGWKDGTRHGAIVEIRNWCNGVPTFEDVERALANDGKFTCGTETFRIIRETAQ